MEQRELVRRAAEGDHDAFTVLARAVHARLSGVAQLITRDPELARDAVQECLMRAWRDLPGLRDPDRFDAWLHRLIVHQSLNATRRRRRTAIEVELMDLDFGLAVDDVAVVADRQVIELALGRLSPEMRTVVVLHYYLGLSLPEVAQAVGIPTGTAKSRLHRSLAMMRASIGIDVGSADTRIPGDQLA